MTLAVDGSTTKLTASRRDGAAKTSLPSSVTLSPEVRRSSTRRSRRGHAFNIVNFGAVNDGLTDATSAIQATIDACALAGGGTVLVPAGEYRTGALWFKSHITLHLDSGSVLRGTDDIESFPAGTSDWEGPAAVPMHTAVINGEELENIAITGRGTIDGGGPIWWDLFKKKLAEI